MTSVLPKIRVVAWTKPSDEEILKASTVLAEAFKYQYFAGGLNSKEDLQVPFLDAHIRAGLVGGVVHVAEDIATSEIVGCAVWFGPGQKFLAGNQRQQGWDAIMQQVSEEARQWWNYFLAAYDKLCEDIDGPGAKLAAWHLQLIGTAPDRQRQGIATALITTAEQEAAKGKKACFIETVGPTNIAVYEALGYKLLGGRPLKSTGGFEFEMVSLRKDPILQKTEGGWCIVQ